jgi:hypothetical protein
MRSWQHKCMTKLVQNGRNSTQARGNAARCFLVLMKTAGKRKGKENTNPVASYTNYNVQTTYHKTFASTTLCKCGVRGCTRNVYLYLHTIHSCWFHSDCSKILCTSAQHQIYWHQLYKQHLAFCTGADVHVIYSLHIKMEHQRTPNSDQAWTQRSTAPRVMVLAFTVSKVEDMFRLTFVIRYLGENTQNFT